MCYVAAHLPAHTLPLAKLTTSAIAEVDARAGYSTDQTQHTTPIVEGSPLIYNMVKLHCMRTFVTLPMISWPAWQNTQGHVSPNDS